MFELQNFIFEKNPSRIDLLNYDKKYNSHNFNVNIYRNHSFELIENTINAYLDFAKININFTYSDYDDSLTFLNVDLKSDLIILWLDITRYKTVNIEQFINERINYLSKIYKGDILFIPFGQDIAITNPNIVTYDLENIKKKLKDKYTDLRLETYSGTKLSPKALIMISKDLGLNYLPSILLPNIKAIVFDLDNTLYKGILGEDGSSGVELTPQHKKLQEYIVELSNKGFFICLASKNEESDVIKLFTERKDFPLKLENITKHYISWEEKSKAIEEIAKFLNIGIDSILFVDDNLGEISSMINAYSNIKTIWAKDNASITEEVLKNFPGLLKLKTNNEDKIRSKDMQANMERAALKDTLSKEDYIKNLGIKLTYGINIEEQIQRISELANKTNQFICTYKRYTKAQVEDMLNNPDYCIITTQLEDKLSDSGIIGVCIFKKEKKIVRMEECFISCRALGRGIDENIIFYPIQLALKIFNLKNLKIDFIKGERNKPAENFMNSQLKEFLEKPNVFNKNVNTNIVKIKIEEKCYGR